MAGLKESLKATLAKNEKEIAELREILDARPVSEILAMRNAFFAKIKGKEHPLPPPLAEELNRLAAREKRLFEIADLQVDPNTVKRLVQLEADQVELKNNLWSLEESRKRRRFECQ